jgi:hypothetical protein
MPGYFFNSAAFFSLARTASENTDDTPSEAVVAVVFSAIAVESFLNEVLERLRFDADREVPELKRARMMSEAADLYEKDASVDVKTQILSASLTGAPIDRGAQPYQDFNLLVRVRNALVHYRPEMQSDDGAPVSLRSLRRSLAARGLFPSDRSEDSAHSVFGDLLTPKVAAWAIETALNMIFTVAGFLPPFVKRKVLIGYPAAGVCPEENAT